MIVNVDSYFKARVKTPAELSAGINRQCEDASSDM